MNLTPKVFDVAIVGAGPAGAAAAITAVNYGLSVCVLDEQARFGGQIFRQPPKSFQVDGWMTDPIYASGRQLIQEAEARKQLHHIPGATVWGVFRNDGPPADPLGTEPLHRVVFHDGESVGHVMARHLLVASGCYEAPLPFRGWDLPGVMSAGGIQTLLKSQRVAAGRKLVLAGTHPLLLTVADQLNSAGVDIAAIVFSQSPLSLAVSLFGSIGVLWPVRNLLQHAAATLRQLRRDRVRILFGHSLRSAEGHDRVEHVIVRDARGHEQRIVCDTVGTCHGFLASSELPRQMGAAHRWKDGHGWLIDVDEQLLTSVPGLSVAGELVGISGAEAAALSGEIAAHGIAHCLGRQLDSSAAATLARKHRRFAHLQRFGRLLARLTLPGASALDPLSDREVLLCRCEDISIGAFVDTLTQAHVHSASCAKALSRVGMGFCQGRMCELNVRRLIAARRACTVAEVPGYTPRLPIKPVPIAAVAACARASEPERSPVHR